MLQKIRARLKQKGQGIVEYALLLGFVAIVAVGLVSSDGLYATFQSTLQSITNRFTTFNEYYGSSNQNGNQENNQGNKQEDNQSGTQNAESGNKEE